MIELEPQSWSFMLNFVPSSIPVSIVIHWPDCISDCIFRVTGLLRLSWKALGLLSEWTLSVGVELSWTWRIAVESPVFSPLTWRKTGLSAATLLVWLSSVHPNWQTLLRQDAHKRERKKPPNSPLAPTIQPGHLMTIFKTIFQENQSFVHNPSHIPNRANPSHLICIAMPTLVNYSHLICIALPRPITSI